MNKNRISIQDGDPSVCLPLFYSGNKRSGEIHEAGVPEVTMGKIREIGNGKAGSSPRSRVISYI